MYYRTSSCSSVSPPLKTGFCKKLSMTFSVRVPKDLLVRVFRRVDPLDTPSYPDRFSGAVSGTSFANFLTLAIGCSFAKEFVMLLADWSDTGTAPWLIRRLGLFPNFVTTFSIACYQIWASSFKHMYIRSHNGKKMMDKRSSTYHNRRLNLLYKWRLNS